MGSCFADSIGARLARNKVETLANPFGTVFQPLALARLLRAAAGEDVDWQRHLVEANGRWQSYDLHSSIGAASPVALLQHIQHLVQRTGNFLRRADVLLLTLGSAWAYRLRETGELVSNCHKQSADLFVKELLTPDEIINGLAETHAYVKRINPNVRFVLTVSPVRHLKDTLPLNAVSKSVLRLATHIVSDLLPGVAYFPAYELLTDDLRDYRFYAADMLHPSEVAEDYIWDKFARTYFDADFGRFRKDWAAVEQALGHRPLHAGAPQHRDFLESTLAKLEQLSLRKVGVEAEMATVRTQLAALPLPTPPELVVEDEDAEERIDIGEGTPRPATALAPEAEAEPAAAPEDRPARLSPEEFRAQRNSRSGRGRRDGRGAQHERHDREAAAGEQETPALAPTLLTQALESIELAALPEMPEPGLLDGAETDAAGESAKRKKRRSRGGAKRTARKHALQLAAELTQNPDGDAGTEAGAGDEALPRTEEKKLSVITKSVPVKRGGRRGQLAQPLYATPAEAAPEAAPAPTVAAADLPTGADEPRTAPENRTTETAAPAPEQAARTRNRGRKNGPGNAASAPFPAEDVAAIPQPMAELAAAPVASPALSGRDRRAERPAPANVLPVAVTDGDADTAAASETPAPAAPVRKSNRAKRVISGGRTEKPAFDTPVIPLLDDATPRTQVAAGRMTGTSATLVEAVAPKAKPAPKVKAAPKKPAAKKAPLPALLPNPAPAAPAPEAPAPAPEASAPAPAKPRPRPAPKPKPAAAAAKPAAVKPAAEAPKPAAKPAAAPKPAATAKAAKATPAAPKPRAAKKPAKPA